MRGTPTRYPFTDNVPMLLHAGIGLSAAVQFTFCATTVGPKSFAAEPGKSVSSFTRKLLFAGSLRSMSLRSVTSGSVLIGRPRRPITSVPFDIPPSSRISKDSRAAAFNWARDRKTSAILIESYNMPKAAMISRLPRREAINSSIKVNPLSLLSVIMAADRQS